MNEQGETQEFMTVDSFSQLPFIRSPRQKPSSSNSGIRLFGFEVPQEPANESTIDEDETKQLNGNNNTSTGNASASVENSRKFECHYCCRNFPTSQALGGHQNAHKRERQHAKRIHLQSAMAAAHAFNGPQNGSVYGLLHYPHSLSSVPTSSIHYPSWQVASNNSSSSLGPRVYSGLGSVAQPINGSPLPGLWRVPGGLHGGLDVRLMRGDHDNHRRHQQQQSGAQFQLPLQLLSDDVRAGGVAGGYPSLSSSSQSQLVCDPKPGLKENVSLDLHL